LGKKQDVCISKLLKKNIVREEVFYLEGFEMYCFFEGLNLTRYVSEATQAIAEAKLKLSDVPTAIDISTLFHRRYGDFSSAMMESWRKVLPVQKGDLVTNPSKLRVDLKLLPEQIAMGLLPTKSSIQLLSIVLHVLVDTDKEDRALMPLINNFAKNFGFEFLGKTDCFPLLS
jgi:hypothetical protein